MRSAIDLCTRERERAVWCRQALLLLLLVTGGEQGCCCMKG